jgi:hypothetical protein
MKMKRIGLVATIGFLMTACNNGNDQLGPGVQVYVDPSSYTWNVNELTDADGNCVYSADRYQDTVAQIVVTDNQDRPIGEAKLSVYLSPSNSTSPPDWNDEYVFYLYDDFNGNGVIDHPQEMVSGTGDPILYETETEKYSGTKTLFVRTNTSCGGYAATLHVYSGDGYGSLMINTVALRE